MMDSEEIELVITELERALEAGVPGDMVELGCNCGTTTIFIAKLLEQRGESRESATMFGDANVAVVVTQIEGRAGG